VPTGADPALHDCVHARHADSGRDDGDADVGEDRIKSGDEPAVAVADQIPHTGAGVLKIHDEVSGHLGRPGCGGVGGHTENPHAAVACSRTAKAYSRAPVRVWTSKKSAARMAAAWLRRKVVQVSRSRSGLGSMPLSLRISHTVEGATAMPRPASSPWIAPVRVLVGHADNEYSDAAHRPWSAGSLRAGPAGVVAPEQGAVPPQDGVGGDDQVKLPQHRSGESVKQCGKERPVGWAKTGPAGLALQDGELVAQCQDFDVFVGTAHRQQAEKRDHAGEGEVGQSQQHDG
jgi:hypothetical protein